MVLNPAAVCEAWMVDTAPVAGTRDHMVRESEFEWAIAGPIQPSKAAQSAA